MGRSIYRDLVWRPASERLSDSAKNVETNASALSPIRRRVIDGFLPRPYNSSQRRLTLTPFRCVCERIEWSFKFL